MTLVTYKPRASIFNDFDYFFDNFLGFNQNFQKNSSWKPDFDITEDGEYYYINADLPGINKKNINLSLLDGVLTISGERTSNQAHDEKFQRYNQVRYGKFERAFYLPEDANEDIISAKMGNGVLDLKIKKSEKILPNSKKISIK